MIEIGPSESQALYILMVQSRTHFQDTESNQPKSISIGQIEIFFTIYLLKH